MADDRYLVVGLGNPGPAYEVTRHNAGFLVADLLADRIGGKFKSHRGRAAVLEGRLGPFPGTPVVLAKPNGFMNTSGGPVAGLLSYFDVPVDRLVVIHDELDLPFGSVRLKRGGGAGGHNGLRSITTSIGTPDFVRIRVGIGRPPGRQDPADYVLRPFSSTERREIGVVLEWAADAVELVVRDGLEAAQNTVHAAT